MASTSIRIEKSLKDQMDAEREKANKKGNMMAMSSQLWFTYLVSEGWKAIKKQKGSE